jgi:sugar phosphate isomerase/epimerase
MDRQIAAQLYTLRNFTQTLPEFEKAMRRVKSLGYSSVQVSAIGPIASGDVARILKDLGLSCCATHASLERIQNDPHGLIDELKSWDCRYTAIGGFFPQNPVSDDWYQFADEFNRAAGALKGSGVQLGYHNHSHELARFDGKTALQILIDRLDPSIFFEIDTYWITHGGGDPAQWIGKVAGRIPCVHLKDMGVNSSREQIMMEVGEGNLNWPAILQACESAGTEWYIVEQDTCYRDPFESLGVSLMNLKAMGGNEEVRMQNAE